jgi:hypothetical protein
VASHDGSRSGGGEGITMSEFPTTVDAAAARRGGIIMGAPNCAAAARATFRRRNWPTRPLDASDYVLAC